MKDYEVSPDSHAAGEGDFLNAICHEAFDDDPGVATYNIHGLLGRAGKLTCNDQFIG